MGFNHLDYVARYIGSDVTINDAVKYGVRIEPANVNPGEAYWRIIGIHHLLEWENVGKQHLFLDVLDEATRRVRDARIAWGWEGMTPDQAIRTEPARVDKPDYEPGGNIGMYAFQKVWAQVTGLKSDRVVNVHTGHADEPPGNTWGHHSFYVVWQRVIAGNEQPEPPIPPEPGDTVKLPLRVVVTYKVYDAANKLLTSGSF